VCHPIILTTTKPSHRPKAGGQSERRKSERREEEVRGGRWAVDVQEWVVVVAVVVDPTACHRVLSAPSTTLKRSRLTAFATCPFTCILPSSNK